MHHAQADDITTASGKVYHHVEVLTRNASAMSIRSDEGDAALSYDELKQADRDKYSKTLAKSIELPALTVIGEKPSFLEDTTRDKAVRSAQKEINKAVEEKKQAEAAKKDQPQQVKMFNGGVNLGLGGSICCPRAVSSLVTWASSTSIWIPILSRKISKSLTTRSTGSNSANPP